jgi:hypothetical protein
LHITVNSFYRLKIPFLTPFFFSRCYGWTVPSNARVFLEGDIRVDIVKSPPLSFIVSQLIFKEKANICF